MKLALDHHYSPRVAQLLRSQGFDVLAAIERDWHDLGDEDLLEQCVAERRALLTNNVKHFVPIAQRWASDGRRHHGIVLTTSGAAVRDNIGWLATALSDLLTENPGEDDLLDRIHWLRLVG